MGSFTGYRYKVVSLERNIDGDPVYLVINRHGRQVHLLGGELIYYDPEDPT